MCSLVPGKLGDTLPNCRQNPADAIDNVMGRTPDAFWYERDRVKWRPIPGVLRTFAYLCWNLTIDMRR